jgi:Domain of unknown function (DUF6398)
MIELEELRIPAAVRPVAEEIVAITDQVCIQHLDTEYAELCRKLTAKLARKRPSPLLRGQRRIWAAGILYAIARINFLFDPSQQPHLRADQLADRIGAKQSTMANKGALILKTLDLSLMDPEYCRRSLLGQNPLAWLVEVDGLIVDARHLPESLQAEAFRQGLIPHIPPQVGAQHDGGTTSDPLDHLIGKILVDCYGEDEELTAFLTILDDEVHRPTEATVLGATVTVTGFNYPDGRRELTAHCRSAHGVQQLALADLAFPDGTVAAWLHAAYRRYLGLKPFPATPPADWVFPYS